MGFWSNLLRFGPAEVSILSKRSGKKVGSVGWVGVFSPNKGGTTEVGFLLGF